MADQTIDLRQVDGGQILDLRHVVLRAGLPRETASFPGDDEPNTIHLAAMAERKIIGCLTLMLRPQDGRIAMQLRGMAIDTAFQRQGVGHELLLEAERIVAAKGINLIWANCRTPAVGFYRKHGWTAISEEFEIPTAGPHVKMIRTL